MEVYHSHLPPACSDLQYVGSKFFLLDRASLLDLLLNLVALITILRRAPLVGKILMGQIILNNLVTFCVGISMHDILSVQEEG